MKSRAIYVLFVTTCQGLEQYPLEQYTPDKTDWSTFNDKAVLENLKNTDHSPDGISWIDRSDWKPWNGTVFDPTKYSRRDLVAEICPGNTVRGLYELFETHKPFADNVNPTKAEVDKWHTISVNHVRAMVGYTEKEYIIEPDKCLHLRALWCHEKWKTDIWDNDKYPERCAESTNPHCGAGFIPDKEDQQLYLPDGIEVCPKKAGSEGLFSAAKSNIPWSIKWARPFCSTLGGEGFWGGHTGPWFHRSQFGWHWNDSEPSNSNSNAGLRTKWSGTSGANKYENPDITSGRFLVNREGVNPNPRFPGYECVGINWLDEVQDSASECYDQMMERDECGKRFMTYNTANNGCACYPTDMAICEVEHRAMRLSWDFEPVEDTYDGLFIDPDEVRTSNKLPYDGRECPRIQWIEKAGDRTHCLQKLVEGNFSECGRKFLTWNDANGGCGCYPPSQETCEKSETIGRSGRQTYELKVDPSYNPPTPTPPTLVPITTPTLAPIATPTLAPAPTKSSPPTDCSNDETGFFFISVKNKVATVQTCEWLKDQEKPKRRNLCKKSVKWFKGEGTLEGETDTFNGVFGPAQKTCPRVCGACKSCYQNLKTKYFHIKNKKGKNILKSCAWLSKKTKKVKKKVCKRTATHKFYQPAAIECPKICSIVSGECVA